MNGTTKDIEGRLAGAIGDGTVSCGTLLFRVISRVVLGNPIVFPVLLVNGIVLITNVSTRVRSAVGQLVKTVTAAEELQDLVGAIDGHIGGWRRSSVTTTIDLTDTCAFTTIDDDLGRLRGVLAAFRLISSQVATAIDCFDVKRLSALSGFGADVVLVRRLCGIDVYGDGALWRTVHIVTTEYLVDDSTLC